MKAFERVCFFLMTFVAGFASAADATGATELRVAVAANFLGTLQTLAPKFEQSSGHPIIASGGASGLLTTQIIEGAPFDVFLSADAERPKQLEAKGLTVEGSRSTYAIGTLVLWSPTTHPIDGEVLGKAAFRHLGIANPASAPYGRAAQEVLTKRGLWDSLNREGKIVVGESITQAWQFAQSGNAEFAFVALSQTLDAQGKATGYSWLPPSSDYSPIIQDAVVLKRTRSPDASQAFVRWLTHDPVALGIIKAAGYQTSP